MCQMAVYKIIVYSAYWYLSSTKMIYPYQWIIITEKKTLLHAGEWWRCPFCSSGEASIKGKNQAINQPANQLHQKDTKTTSLHLRHLQCSFIHVLFYILHCWYMWLHFSRKDTSMTWLSDIDVSLSVTVSSCHDLGHLFPQLKPSLQRGGSSASLHNSTMRSTIFQLMIHTLDPLREGEYHITTILMPLNSFYNECLWTMSFS